MVTHDDSREASVSASRESDGETSLFHLPRYENYVSLLVRTSIGELLRSKVDATDVVQEVLLRAHEHEAQFKGRTEAELAGWLRQITSNTLSDIWRRYSVAGSRSVTRERSLDAMLDASSQAIANLLADSGTTPSQAVERRDLGVVVADALAELTEEHRMVILLRSLRDESWEVVAHRMQRSVNAARMLWVRALKELRPQIEARMK